MSDLTATDVVLTICDAGGTVEQMCVASGLRSSRVYGILRDYRPNRPRQPRRRTSNLPRIIRGMAAAPHNISPVRIAFVLNVSKAYVYKILGPQRH